MALTHQLYISFDDVDTADADRTWVDFSSSLLSFSVDGGRDSELSDLDATNGEYVLDDRDRDLDPTNTASPHYPDVVPNRMLWHRVTDGVSLWDVIKGYVDGWGPTRTQGGGFDQRARVRVSDGVKLLTLNTFTAADPDVLDYEDVISADEPSFYYRLGEPEGTKVVHHVRKKRKRRERESRRHYHKHGFRRWTTRRTRAEAEGISGPAGTYKNTPTLGEPGAIAGDADTSVYFTRANNEQARIGTLDSEELRKDQITVEAWVKYDVVAGGPATIVSGPNAGGGNPIFLLQVDSNTDQRFHFQVDLAGTQDVYSTTTAGTTWHHVVGTYDGTNLRIYVDSVLENTTVFAGTIANPSANGYLTIGGRMTAGSEWNGWIDEVAVYEKALSADRVLAHYEAGFLGFDSNTTGGRILDVLRLHDPDGAEDLTLSGNEITDALRTSGPTGDARPLRYARNIFDPEELGQTTLSGAMTSVQTTIPLTAIPSQWPTNSAFRVFVDKETIIVQPDGTLNPPCVRGVTQIWGSAQAAAAHSSGAVVTNAHTPMDVWEFKAPTLGGIFSDQAELTTAPSGQRALKMTVRPGDQSDSSDATRERIEGVFTGGAGDTGERWFYRWSNEFPSTFADNNLGCFIGQLGPNHNSGTAAVYIRVNSNDVFVLGFNAGVLDTGTFVGTFTDEYQLDMPVTKEVRHDWILEIDWELTATGKLNLWHREEGQAWEKVLELESIITSSSLSGVTPAIKRKHGIYRSAHATFTNYLYLSNVAQAASWEDVQFEDAPPFDLTTGIWPAATNILTAQLTQVGGTASSADDSTHQLLGGAMRRVDLPATNDSINRTFTGLTIGNPYTFSIWVEREEIDSRFLVAQVRNNANSATIASLNIRRQTGLQRVTVPFTATETAGRVRIIVTDASNTPARFWEAGAQLEAGPIATPFAGYSGTRSAARVRVPSATMDETQMSMVMWVRPGWSPSGEPGASFERFYDRRADSSNLISFYYNESTNNMTIRRQTGGAGSDATQAASFNAGEEIMLAFVLTATQTKVSVNGEPFSTASNSSIPDLSAVTTADFGSNSGTSEHMAGDVRTAAWTLGTLSDDDVAALYEVGPQRTGLSAMEGFRVWNGWSDLASAWNIQPGQRSMPPARYAGLPPKELVDDAVAAEGEPAGFFIAPNGVATYLDSSSRSQTPYNVPLYSFGLEDIEFEDASRSDSDTFLYNIIRGTNDEGTRTFSAEDATSIARFGRLVLPLDSIPLGDDDEIQAYVDELLARYKDPMIRIPSFVLSSSADAESLLTLGFGVPIVVTLPMVSGDSSVQSSYVEKRRIWQDESGVLMGQFSISPR